MTYSGQKGRHQVKISMTIRIEKKERVKCQKLAKQAVFGKSGRGSKSI